MVKLSQVLTIGPVGLIIVYYKPYVAREFTIQMLEVNGTVHNKINSVGFESMRYMRNVIR